MGRSVEALLKERRELERRLQAVEGDDREDIEARLADVRNRYLDAVCDVEASMLRQEPDDES